MDNTFGFGAKSDRFTQFGIHPKMKNPGGYIGYAYSKEAIDMAHLGPGKYPWDKTSIGLENHSTDWGKQVNKTLRRRTASYDSELDRLQRLGPGTYEYEDRESRVHSKRGQLSQLASRFPPMAGDAAPGPGTYGEGGNPWASLEARSRTGPCRIGQMDSKTSGERTLPVVGTALGPGTYEIPSFADEMRAKQVGTRGPYDIFSGSRSKPIKTGHLAVLPSNELGPGQYSSKSGIDEFLGNRYTKRHGEFRKVSRFLRKPLERVFWTKPGDCPREPEDPGPAQYTPSDPNFKHSSTNEKPPPFFTSASRSDRRAFLFFTGAHNPVGAGRYDVHKADASRHVWAHESDFRSLTLRADPKVDNILKERLRSRDLPAGRNELGAAPDLNSGVGAHKAVVMSS